MFAPGAGLKLNFALGGRASILREADRKTGGTNSKQLHKDSTRIASDSQTKSAFTEYLSDLFSIVYKASQKVSRLVS
jgi:hypothetical protein